MSGSQKRYEKCQSLFSSADCLNGDEILKLTCSSVQLNTCKRLIHCIKKEIQSVTFKLEKQEADTF